MHHIDRLEALGSPEQSGGVPARRRFRRDGLLGTVIEVAVDSDQPTQVANGVFAEVERLADIFNWFDDASELRRWARGETAAGQELAEVLDLAEDWKRRSGGAFDPAAGALVGLWTQASEEGRVPSMIEIAEAVEVAATSGGGRTLNAVAKGWIVDQAVRREVDLGFEGTLIVNAGGDLRHVGADPIIAGIEDPRRPYDNVPPLVRVAVHNMALATSGGGRRHWIIGGRRYGHILDPRTGYPPTHVESASVLAHEVATADVMATILTIVSVAEGLALSEEADVGCCIIDDSGVLHRNERWRHAERMSSPRTTSGSPPDVGECMESRLRLSEHVAYSRSET